MEALRFFLNGTSSTDEAKNYLEKTRSCLAQAKEGLFLLESEFQKRAYYYPLIF